MCDAGTDCRRCITPLPVGYIYDAEGNLTAKGTHTTLTCSVSDLTLTNVYLLGPDGKTITELDGSGSWLHTDVSAGDQMATYDADGLHFRLADWLGTQRVQTDYAGVVENKYQHLPFGELVGSDAGATEKHFTGQEHDTESMNDYFKARYMASAMGRFMSPDTLLGSPDDPQSLNLYAYVKNNSLTNIDPDGHDCIVQTRTSDTTEDVKRYPGTCDNVMIGDGESKAYIPGIVDMSSIKGDGSGGISLTYTPYNTNADVGTPSLNGAPYPDSTNLALNWGNNARGYQTFSNANGVVQAAAIGQAAIYGGVVCYFACPAGAAAVGRWGLQRLAFGASSPALLNLINRLYQAQDEIAGGTAGAVRNELLTGEYINVGHIIKAQEMVNALNNQIDSGELSAGDVRIARLLIADLKSSLGK